MSICPYIEFVLDCQHLSRQPEAPPHWGCVRPSGDMGEGEIGTVIRDPNSIALRKIAFGVQTRTCPSGAGMEEDCAVCGIKVWALAIFRFDLVSLQHPVSGNLTQPFGCWQFAWLSIRVLCVSLLAG